MFQKTIIAIILIIVFGGPAPAQRRKRQSPSSPTHKALKLELPDAINVIRPSMVQIIAKVVSKQPNARPVFIQVGSGFFVSPLHVITARHVVRPTIGPDVSVSFFVGLPYANIRTQQGLIFRGNFHLNAFEILGEDGGHDIALLKVNVETGQLPIINDSAVSPLPPKPAKLNLTEIHDGLPIAISGYPLSTTVLMTNSGHVASSWSFPGVNPQGLQLLDTFAADIRGNPGNSGGPVYLISTGEVVGLFVSVNNAQVQAIKPDGNPETVKLPDGRPLLYNSGLANIVPAKYVRALMDKHQVGK